MPQQVLILKHVSNEGAGTIAGFLKRNKIPMREIELHTGGKLPVNFEDIRAVCVMGGPMNVYEEEKHPFLREEQAFIQKLLKTDIPVLGICLGSQLIAKALGAKVYKAPKPEIGWDDVILSESARVDRLFRHAPFPAFRVLQWHEDTFDLPAGAKLLASSAVAPHQAYRYGQNTYGLQFHVEVDEKILKDWFKNREDLSKILKDYSQYKERLKSVTDRLYSEFFLKQE